MLGEFGDNSCSLLISPAHFTRTLIRVCLWSQQVDIAGGKDDKPTILLGEIKGNTPKLPIKKFTAPYACIIYKQKLENYEGTIKKDNPEKLAT